MNLALLRNVVDARHADWERAGARWAVTHYPATDKPAARLDLTTDATSGTLILWTSGEAKLEWGTESVDGQRHFDLDDPSGVHVCVDELDLERVVGLR